MCVCGWASALSAKAVNIREIYNAADDDDGPRRRTTATTTTTSTALRILAYESVSGALQSSSESNHRRPLDSTTRRQEGNTTPRVRDSHNAYRAANPPDFAADTDTISARYAAHSTQQTAEPKTATETEIVVLHLRPIVATRRCQRNSQLNCPFVFCAVSLSLYICVCECVLSVLCVSVCVVPCASAASAFKSRNWQTASGSRPSGNKSSVCRLNR